MSESLYQADRFSIPATLPHSHEAEQGILGGIILGASQGDDILALLPRLEVDDFYDPRHRHVFAAMRNLEAGERPIDLVTLEDALGDKYEPIGGLAYLGELALRVPTPDNVEHYAEIVKEHRISRDVALRLDEVLQQVRRGEVAGDDAVNAGIEAMRRVELGTPVQAVTFAQAAAEEAAAAFGDFDRIAKGETVTAGVPTGFRQLDEHIGGIPFDVETLVIARPGMGKCLAPETPVLRHDGAIVRAVDVRVGDELMGPDSQPRHVVSLGRGRAPMYRIVPTRGKPWVCNDVHVLTLVSTDTGETVDVPLDQYLSKSQRFRNRHKLFQAEGVTFPARPDPEIDPYFLGVWFGDGTKERREDGPNGVQISSMDPEIVVACEQVASRWGVHVTVIDRDRCPRYALCVPRGTGANPLLDALRRVVGPNCEIPASLTLGSWRTRLDFLAGFVDTDGYRNPTGGFEISQKRIDYADAIEFTARSVGLWVSRAVKVVDGVEYQRLVLGGDLSKVPTRIARKRVIAKPRGGDKLRSAFSVEAIGEGDYAGFELDGDGRFLLGDFTVTHNTTFATEVCRNAIELMDDTPIFVSCEDGKQSFGQRELAARSGVSTQDVRRRSLDLAKIRALSASLNRDNPNSPILLNMPGATVDEVIRAVRQIRLRPPRHIARRTGTIGRLVVVDYLSKLKWPDVAVGQRAEYTALSYASLALSDFAAKEHIAVMALQQLSRPPENRDSKVPQLTDIRGSGRLEEDGKLILALLWPYYYDQKENPNDYRVPILKNHNGEANRVAHLYADMATNSFADSAIDLAARRARRSRRAA